MSAATGKPSRPLGRMGRLVIWVILIAIGCTFVFQADIGIPEASWTKLGDPTYDIHPLDAPVATGLKLRILAYLMSHGPQAPLLRRYLLNKNGMHKLRELNAQIEGSKFTPLTHPINRHPAQEIIDASHAQVARGETLLQTFSNDLSNDVDKTHQTFSVTHPRRTIRHYNMQYQKGIKPSDIMRKTLSKISQWDSAHGMKMFSAILPDEVIQAAEESDARYAAGKPLSILDGVPIAVKDMIYITNHVNYNGKSPLPEHSAGHITPTAADEDTMITRLRAVGAIILGATVMTEGGVTPLGWSAHFQGPYNAYNFDRYCGGSSSGSAVAVSSGIVPVAIGFDGGGSIRIPGSMSGVHGLGVTFGRIPFDVGLDTTMIKPGPLAATAEDAALVYAVLSDNKKGHFYSEIFDGDVHGPPQASLSSFNSIKDLSDIRIGIYKEWFYDSDPTVYKACDEAVKFLTSRGATIVYINIPHLQIMSMAHASKIATEFAMKFDSTRYSRSDSMEPNTKVTIGLGSSFTSLEVISADHIRAWAFAHVNDLMEKENLSCIITPTMGVLPPPLSDSAMTHGENNTPLVVQLLKYIYLGNFLGLPGHSVPVAYAIPEEGKSKRLGSGSAVPIGLHMMGKHFGEDTLLRLAHAIDRGYMEAGNKFVMPPLFHDPFEMGSELAS